MCTYWTALTQLSARDVLLLLSDTFRPVPPTLVFMDSSIPPFLANWTRALAYPGTGQLLGIRHTWVSSRRTWLRGVQYPAVSTLRPQDTTPLSVTPSTSPRTLDQEAGLTKWLLPWQRLQTSAPGQTQQQLTLPWIPPCQIRMSKRNQGIVDMREQVSFCMYRSPSLIRLLYLPRNSGHIGEVAFDERRSKCTDSSSGKALCPY